jgi:hypothetical protein
VQQSIILNKVKEAKKMLKNMLMGLKIFKLEGLWLFVEQNV